MRSLNSSEVICNISMRWRSCGVSTRRWDRLVVNLSDIWVRDVDYNRLGSTVADGSRKAAETPQTLHEDLNTPLQAEFFTEIEPAHLRVVGEVAWLARSENPSLGHDVRTVRHAESFSHVVIGD